VPTRCDLEALVEAVQAGRWESLESWGWWRALLSSERRSTALATQRLSQLQKQILRWW